MKTNSRVRSGKFWLGAVTVALFLLPVTAAAQAGKRRDRIGNINRGRVGVVTTVEPGERLDLNAKLKIRSGGFFLENTALLRAGRGTRVIPSSPPFDPVVLAYGSTDGNIQATIENASNGSSAQAALTFLSDNGTADILLGSAADQMKIQSRSDVSNGIEIRTLAAADITFSPNNSAAVTIKNGGNVGIGNTTPGFMLDVNGAVRTTNQFRSDLNGGGFYHSFAGAGMWGQSDYLRLTNWNDASKGINIQVSTGNVGIGNTTPGFMLDINGAVRTTNQFRSDLNGGGFYHSFAGAGMWGESNYLRLTNWYDSNKGINIQVSTGNVAIGKPTPTAKLDVDGDLKVSGNISAKYQDVAEWVQSSEQLSAGTVVVLDATQSNQVIASSVSYDTRIAGVISAQPGITLGEKGDSKVLVATTGRVKVKVDAAKGPIRIGDLLVTSDVPGVAMKSEAVNLGGVQFHRPGTLIGKALEPLEKGKGEILVLLSLQ